MKDRTANSVVTHYAAVFLGALVGGEALRLFIESLLPGTVPFVRYLFYLLAAKLAGDVTLYFIEHGRKEWLYLEDYLLNDVFLVYRYGLFLIIAQAYLAGHVFMLYHPALGALWRTSALDAAFYLYTRVAQDQELDEAHRPGRSGIPQGG